MTEIQIPYLPSAQFFKIRCRLGINEQDIIGDSDSNPQIRTIGGTVTIFSMVPRFRYTEADGRSRMVYTKTETYNIQTSTGELFDADGNIGVALLNTNSPQMDPQGWTYRATVRPNGGEPFDVNIPSDPEGGVFDLGDGLVFTPSTGITALETRVKALEDAQGSTPGLPVNFDEAVQDIVGAMVTGAGGSYNDAAGAIALPGGGSSTIAADDTPAAPAEGESASYLVTSAVVWPAGLVWSTDPDGGVAPTITGTALVSLFTVGGTTRAIMGATFPGAVVPDTTAPVAGTLAPSAITDTGFTLTISGAADAGGLHAQPYTFDEGSGTFGAWQTSPSLVVTGKTADTAYTCRHKVRDAASNESTGASITVTTSAAPAPTGGLDDAILALNPAGYWKLNETSGTQATDYSGNSRHGVYAGALSLAGRDGFVSFGGDAWVHVPHHPEFELSSSGNGLSVVTLLYPTSLHWDDQGLVNKYETDLNYSWLSRVSDGGVRANWQPPGFNMGESTLTTSGWNLFVATASHPGPAATATTYVNDSTANLVTNDTTPRTSNAPLYIGKRGSSGNQPSYMSFGHTAIFPRKLSDAEVETLMLAARADGLIA